VTHPPGPARRPAILPHFGASIFARALLAWAAVRFAASAATGAMARAADLPRANPLHLNPFAAALVLLIVAGVGLVSLRGRNEDTFLLCLGYGRLRQMAMFVAPGAVLEIVLALTTTP
jgi:hypothetical protein